jgi:hypothetical protein
LDEKHFEKPPEAQPVNKSDARVPENIQPNPEEENMEVHHHSHHTHEKRTWQSYFWEFLMLFLAITLGFFVENQREHYIEHLRAKEFSKSLIEDLQNDLEGIRVHKHAASNYIAMADSMIALSKNRLEGREASRFSFYTRFMYWTAPIVWNRATFDQIKNSGSLRYFKNNLLLEKIMKYDGLIKEIEAEAYNRQVRGNLLLSHINQIIDPEYHQQLSEYFIYTIDTLSNKSILDIFPEHSDSLENKRSEIRELLNMVVVQQRNLRRDIEITLKKAAELANELIVDLEKEYQH